MMYKAASNIKIVSGPTQVAIIFVDALASKQSIVIMRSEPECNKTFDVEGSNK